MKKNRLSFNFKNDVSHYYIKKIVPKSLTDNTTAFFLIIEGNVA